MSKEVPFDLGRGVTRGDIFPWRRRFRSLGGLSVTKARLTFKDDLVDADPGILQKTITTTPSADGQVEDTGASSGIASIRFDMTATNTLLFTANLHYLYDLQLTMSDGQVLTQLSGHAVWQEQVTVNSP